MKCLEGLSIRIADNSLFHIGAAQNIQSTLNDVIIAGSPPPSAAPYSDFGVPSQILRSVY